jgi:hypothetical protein
MEAKMDMQRMLMHNSFWRENQVIVTFHSAAPLISADEVNNGQAILKELDLESQRQKLNEFLKENHLNFTLSFYGDEDKPQEPPSSQLRLSNDEEKGNGFNPPPGVYLFGLSSPIQSPYGEVSTSVVTCFNFKRDTGKDIPLSITDATSEAGVPSGTDKDDDDNDRHHRKGPVVRIVNQFNTSLEKLNKDEKWQVPISAASPLWLCGATVTQGPVPQGCPLTPPMPVDDSGSSALLVLLAGLPSSHR